MEVVYIIVGLVALAAVYFLFFKKPEEPALPPAHDREKLPPSKAEQRREKETQPRRAEPAGGEAGPEPIPPSLDLPIPEAGDHHEVTEQRLFTRRADVQGLRSGLAKSRDEAGIFGKLKALFSGRGELNADIAEEIEEVLISSDVGVQTAQTLLERIREGLSKGDLADSNKVWDALRDEAKQILDVDGEAGPFKLRARPTVVLLVGVNGSGKTTTIGKLATKLKAEGHTCLLAAGDTFRAAAVQQLTVWGSRVGCEVFRGKEGADPSSVVFDAIKKGEELGADVVLVDTAGRLHTKTNLMAEMQKIARSAGKALEGAPHETLLVIDATNGQNALAQANQFKEALDLSGIVLTKLDGTAKGGVVLGISDALKLPVRFIGLGERPNDLHEFSPEAFVEALLGKDSEANAA